MPRETVLSGFVVPPPNARADSGALSLISETYNWVYFRMRNNSTSANVIVTSIFLARSDNEGPMPIRIESVSGNPVDSAGVVSWLDLNRSGVPNVNCGSNVSGSYPFAGLVTNNRELARFSIDSRGLEVPFPLVLPPGRNILIHTMSRGTFVAVIYFFAQE